MATFIDTKTTWAITFHEVVFIFGPFMAMVSFFTVILNTYQHNLFLEKLKQIYFLKKITPFIHRFSSLKTQGKTWKQVKLTDIAYSDCYCFSKGHLSPPPTFFWSNLLYFQALICSSFVI